MDQVQNDGTSSVISSVMYNFILAYLYTGRHFPVVEISITWQPKHFFALHSKSVDTIIIQHSYKSSTNGIIGMVKVAYIYNSANTINNV